jgi:hypothetical protein
MRRQCCREPSWLARLGGQERVERQDCRAVGKAASSSRVQRMTLRDQWLKLEGRIGLPSRSGESPAFGEDFHSSFGLRTIKVRTRMSARQVFPRGIDETGESYGRDRLEQR